MFGLNTAQTKEFPYGNCAETESLSNLLKKEADVREKIRPRSAQYTEAKRDEARGRVLTELRAALTEVDFKWEGNKFYKPRQTEERATAKSLSLILAG